MLELSGAEQYTLRMNDAGGTRNRWWFFASIWLGLCLAAGLASEALAGDALARRFATPPDSARPWVYWYFMDGNLSREGMTADLEAMQQAGIGGVIFLEVDIGIPRGPVKFMSPEWQTLFAHAVAEAHRLGIEVAVGTGPGWCGSGGPWVKPEQSMKHLVASEKTVTGPARFEAPLPLPAPRKPFFGEGTLTPALAQSWRTYYQDEAVLAFPTPSGSRRIADADEKAIYHRAPFSSQPGVKPYLPAPAEHPTAPDAECIDQDQVIDLTRHLRPDGTLAWDVPPGSWTILRFGRTLTGQTTRPAPEPGLGFETDKFDPAAIDAHLDFFAGKLLQKAGAKRGVGRGLTTLHFDSWEMSSQNWSENFRAEFKQRRGYDPIDFLPAYTGRVVGSVALTERFLWDVRQTAQELVIQNHVGRIRDYAHRHGLNYSSEPYDMNPCSDLELGSLADIPMCEFWSLGYGFRSEYSCFEAVSIAHTTGKTIVGAEAFTAAPGEDWRQHPASMKAQGDWAFCTGINRFAFHRYQHQPRLDQWPGMTMGPYGVFWERTQTWWDLVTAYHAYLSRCQEMLRQGLPVADILYLAPEGAPHVFRPPASATVGDLPDRRGYNFDGCAPGVFLASAQVVDGRIQFPDGMSYRMLVLPSFDTMTPPLLGKIRDLVAEGATVVGHPPRQSPSLQDYPRCDAQVALLADELWGRDGARRRKFGRGLVIRPPASESSRDALGGARWIWHAEGQPHQAAPMEERFFFRTVDLDPAKRLDSAWFQITADNTFELSVNGVKVAEGNDFRTVQRVDIEPLLKTGRNDLRVLARNQGDQPNPAGWIGALHIRFADGSDLTVVTDRHWESAKTPESNRLAAQDLGAFGTSPWNLSPPPADIYPDYEFTAKVLADEGVPPDFSSDGDVRYTHRRTKDADLYFVGNRTAAPASATATFRVAGKQPEWWDPITGQIRRLNNFRENLGQTHIPLRLEAGESGFVVFRRAPQKPNHGTVNFPARTDLQTIVGPWTVAFDPHWGGPPQAEFSQLSDWTQRPEDGIRHYSGKAVYLAQFDAPQATSSVKESELFLSLGEVKNLASVRLNGEDLGTAWCAPWRLKIPRGILRAKDNKLEITVANLWINRLIRDSSLPEGQRLTKTTRNPYRPESPLQPSGLLGPVTIQQPEKSP